MNFEIFILPRATLLSSKLGDIVLLQTTQNTIYPLASNHVQIFTFFIYLFSKAVLTYLILKEKCLNFL